MVWQALDDAFDVKTDTRASLLYGDGAWLEGPAFAIQSRQLFFSDIPRERVLRFDELTGVTVIADSNSGFANGRTFDRQGRMVSCLHGDRSIVRREHDGTVRTLCASFGGVKLNSPNDVVVNAAGEVWFTDPTYGIMSYYEGYRAPEEQSARGVYRWREGDPEPSRLIADIAQPNGLGFSPDESRLYVTDSEGQRILVAERGDEYSRTQVLVSGQYGFDGIAVDSVGRIWAATHEGLSCFSPDGRELARLALPQVTSNVAFGGLRRNTLYVTSTTSLYSFSSSVTGAL
jgi:gluconolactonase